MTQDEQIEQLEAKIAQAYQIIGVLLAGPDGNGPAFDSEAGQAILSYFAGDRYDEDLLPWVYPMAESPSDS